MLSALKERRPEIGGTFSIAIEEDKDRPNFSRFDSGETNSFLQPTSLEKATSWLTNRASDIERNTKVEFRD